MAKTVLFLPLNSPGHINSSIALANILRDEHQWRVVFAILGDEIGTTILDHGHERRIIQESEPYQDYEVLDFEDPEADLKLAIEQGRPIKTFSGATKWPQIIVRMQNVIIQASPLDAFIGSFSHFEYSMIQDLSKNHAGYSEVLDAITPDLIIIDSYFIPPCVLKSNVPWVKLYSANPLALTRSKLPGGVKPPHMCGVELLDKVRRQKLRDEEPEKWAAMVGQWESDSNRIRDSLGATRGDIIAFYESHGCESPPTGSPSHHSPYLNVYTYPKHLDYDQDDDIFEYSPNYLGVDSMIRNAFGKKSSPDKSKFWLDKFEKGIQGKKASVFFSLGTIASGNIKLVTRMIDMFKDDTERLYIVSKGINGSKFSLPDNMIGGNYIPQTFFLKRVDLAIIHGGNNSVIECCYYGTPTIVLPQFSDQLDNAQRIQDLGLGRRLDGRRCTKEQMMEAINEVLADTELIDRCRKIGESMRSRDEPRKLAKVMSRLVSDGGLSHEFIDQCRKTDFVDLCKVKTVS